jgi:glycosyltransferase involved in cell wall biosynthesis
MPLQLGVVMLMRQFYPRSGGYQNQALRLAQEMIKRNINVYVVTQWHRSLRRYEVYQGIPIYRVFALQSGYLASFSYLCSSLLWMVRNQHKFQIVHANRSSSGLIAGLISFVLGKKALYKLTRGDEIGVKGLGITVLGRLKLEILKRTVDKFISINRDIENELKRLGIPAQRLACIPNGIGANNDSAHFSEKEKELVKSELGWGSEIKVVTFVGRLVQAKGIDWLLDVWRDVIRAEGLARLLIVGDGPERSSLETQARSLGVNDTVAFVGYQRQVPRLLAATDIFVLPSRREGMSNALLEAMSQGLPVVVADDELGGNRAVVDDQLDGYLVQFGDSRSLADSLLQLLRDAELRKGLGLSASRKTTRRFSIDSIADRYCQIYTELSPAFTS